MLAIYNEELIDLAAPVPVKRGLLKIILYIFLVFCCESYPDTLRFHAYLHTDR